MDGSMWRSYEFAGIKRSASTARSVEQASFANAISRRKVISARAREELTSSARIT